ncbi:MAG: hypothetical protein GY729_12740 [Desulfobacteraceae bacterium]|nr:hypothetical protein [Desulfobacteraceae bacterium]
MDPIPCACCDTFFIPRNKRQQFCSKPACQRARKALWQKQKLATDPEYRKGQRLANQKWLANNPDYWKKYRKRNPEKAYRNRALQRIRNQREQPDKAIGIAKIDVRKACNQSLLGKFWLVPTIAKMDPIKIFITTAPGCSS